MGVATPPNDFKKPRPSWSEVKVVQFFPLDHEKIAVTNTELWSVDNYVDSNIGGSSIPGSVLTSFSTFV